MSTFGHRRAIYSYGLYPKTGFNALFPTRTVDGCIHHPDRGHEPPLATHKEIAYNLPKDRWGAALDFAVGQCQARPRYNLFKNNCHDVRRRRRARRGRYAAGELLDGDRQPELDL